ncbi:AAA family ATPase ['Camptotheca acuminata' phytoplasma]|uniref:AAA family ATPase n=1 Tax='Camptotheca acuminata' phytoplasma TaxID=3239192 RepID=UPI00351A7DC6
MKNPSKELFTGSDNQQNTQTLENLLYSENKSSCENLIKILNNILKLDLQLLKLNRDIYNFQQRMNEIKPELIQNKLKINNQYINLKQDIITFLTNNLIFLKDKINNFHQNKTNKYNELIDKMDNQKEQIKINYQNKFNDLSSDFKQDLKSKWNTTEELKPNLEDTVFNNVFQYNEIIDSKKSLDTNINNIKNKLNDLNQDNMINVFDNELEPLFNWSEISNQLINNLEKIINNEIHIYFNHFSNIVVVEEEFLPNVVGASKFKEELKTILDYVKNPKKYKEMGVDISKGYLLYGPPGTGKTFIVKEFTKTSGLKFLYMSGSSFQSDKYVGTGVKAVQELFQNARKMAPCIIFIDEIDAVASHRSKSPDQSGGSKSYDKTLDELLTQLDGFVSKEQPLEKPIFIFGATNLPESLDKALLRPGRLDKHIKIDIPNLSETKEFLQFFLKNRELSPDVKNNNRFLDELSQRCYNQKFSQSHLKKIISETALMALRENNTDLRTQNFEDSFQNVLATLNSKEMLPLKPNLSQKTHLWWIIGSVLIISSLLIILFYYRKHLRTKKIWSLYE